MAPAVDVLPLAPDFQEAQCFSVVFRHPQLFQKSVDMIAENADAQRNWVIALRHLVKQRKQQVGLGCLGRFQGGYINKGPFFRY